MVQPVCSDGSADIHLAPHDWDNDDDTTLCDLPVNLQRPDKSFVRHGCLHCANRAVSAGIFAVRENEASVINLARFIDSHMPPEPPETSIE